MLMLCYAREIHNFIRFRLVVVRRFTSGDLQLLSGDFYRCS